VAGGGRAAEHQGFIAIPPGGELSAALLLFWTRFNMDGIKGRAGGTTFAEISKAAFRPIPVGVPPKDRLGEFERTVGPLLDPRARGQRRHLGGPMTPPTLGRLTRVDLRASWKNEASDFTPWLAREENIALLAEAIGLDGLEVQSQEQAVGPFRADILCRETTSGSLVLIENQLTRTDHTHLGQLLTYAAGLKAVSLVWIAERFTDEHRAALDWLNEITDDSFRAFGLEVELWRIGDSPPAPKFNVVAQPNEWAKVAHEVARTQPAPGSAGATYAEFWNEFGVFLGDRRARFKPPKAGNTTNWWSWGVGRTTIALCLRLDLKNGQASVFLNLGGPDARAHFYLLKRDEAAIASDLGETPTWEDKPENKEKKVLSEFTAPSADRAHWPTVFAWALDRLDAYDRTFRPRVGGLDASTWDGGPP
jgi:hypothetical protein